VTRAWSRWQGHILRFAHAGEVSVGAQRPHGGEDVETHGHETLVFECPNVAPDQLLDRVRSGKIAEVILATNPTVEGDATATYIAGLLKPLGITVSRIALGLPVGGDLDYADDVTIARSRLTWRSPCTSLREGLCPWERVRFDLPVVLV